MSTRVLSPCNEDPCFEPLGDALREGRLEDARHLLRDLLPPDSSLRYSLLAAAIAGRSHGSLHLLIGMSKTGRRVPFKSHMLKAASAR